MSLLQLRILNKHDNFMLKYVRSYIDLEIEFQLRQNLKLEAWYIYIIYNRYLELFDYMIVWY